MGTACQVPFKVVQDGSHAQQRKGYRSPIPPIQTPPPSWVKVSASDTVKEICSMAKKGYTPSQIGVVLRDSHGIPQVKMIAGNKIVRILRAQGLAPALPEDLYCLIKKAVAVRKHLEKNRKDKDSKFRLILIESRIHRLARYYREAKTLPANFKYESANAAAMVSM